MDWDRYAYDLHQLESKENAGRGVSCVRTIITYLCLGDITSAKTVEVNDHDKIRNYPEIDKYLETLRSS